MVKRGLNHLILAGNSRNVAPLREALPKHVCSHLVGEIMKSPIKGAYQLMFGTSGEVQNFEFYQPYSA